MQGHIINLDGQAVTLLASLIAALMSAWTRAGLAELRAQLGREQEQRCANCEVNRFAGKGEFEQLAERMGDLKGAHHG